jgi:SAM-dependent methyltransferase
MHSDADKPLGAPPNSAAPRVFTHQAVRTVDAAISSDAREAAEYYDERYRQGYMSDWPVEKCQRVAEIIRQCDLPAQGRALDFGCGAGVFTGVLKNALPGWEIHGTDISADAMAAASRRLPDCRFHALIELEKFSAQFDLVFSHHVLEHVQNIAETAGVIERLLKPRGHMLHILPCGDSGSLEHRICTLRRDGIQAEREFRFALDEEGHLRRLTTERLVALWSGKGFTLADAQYANRWHGALKYLTDTNLEVVRDSLDPSRAVDAGAAAQLRRLRLGMMALWALRKPARLLKDKLRQPRKGLRDWALLLGALVAWPLSAASEWVIDKLVKREWKRDRRAGGGSEMYVVLSRAAAR